MENLGVIILLVILVLVCVILIIGIIRQKKKNVNAGKESNPQLNEWIKNAKALGKGYAEMKALLEKSGWDKNMIEKALKENGVN
jgi:preprotein translocase subunit SecG